jgi:predicted ATPase/DNA-binding XRE family transcriptional regulator
VLLQQFRQSAGLSQEELAERAGLSARGISDLERGVRRSPYPVTVRALAKALGLDPSAQARLLAAVRPRSGVPEPQASTASLPTPLSSFVGREREVAEIGRLLATTRLLTLVGPGGVGKTRLALEVAHAVSAPDGVWVVELAPLADADLVPGAIASVLGVKENPTRSIGQSLAEALGDSRAVLVLDNFEHVIEAAPEVASLLRACAGLKVLATSREPLWLQGERVYDVPPLALPVDGELDSLDEVSRVPAIELFVERAQAVNAGFRLNAASAPAVAELCRRLDGLPLAIELAAARTRAFEPGVILERIDRALDLFHGFRDQPSRHTSLRAVLDWSYDLLSQYEQVLLRRLAVFAGGWTLAAAEAVCVEGPLGPPHLLDAVEGLVTRSLATLHGPVGEGRYRVLETVRQYALDRLEASGEADAMRERHAMWVTELVERTPPEAYDPETLALLDREQDNLRAALRWAIDAGDADRALRLSSNWLFWSVRGHYTEARAWLMETLDMPGAETSALRGRGLCVLGYLAYVQGDLYTAERLLDESQRLALERGNYVLRAASLHNLASVASVRGDLRGAFTLLSEARALTRRARKPREGWAWESMHLGLMSGLALMLGEEAEARRLAQECLALSRELGHSMSTASALHVLGKLAARAGEAGTARAMLGESLALHRQLGNQRGVARVLTSLGDLALEETDVSTAARCYAEALRVAEATGDRFDIATCLAGIARLTSSRDAALAVRLASSARAVWDEFGAKPYPEDAAALDHTLSDLRARLTVHVFDHSWQLGQARHLHEAIGVALAAAEAEACTDGQPVSASRIVVPLRARPRTADLQAAKSQQQAGC